MSIHTMKYTTRNRVCKHALVPPRGRLLHQRGAQAPPVHLSVMPACPVSPIMLTSVHLLDDPFPLSPSLFDGALQLMESTREGSGVTVPRVQDEPHHEQ